MEESEKISWKGEYTFSSVPSPFPPHTTPPSPPLHFSLSLPSHSSFSSSYVPSEKTGYFGCLDMYVLRNFDSVFEIFRGSGFTEHYLNSPLQSGLSATCYATVSHCHCTSHTTLPSLSLSFPLYFLFSLQVYVREVSFAAGAEGVAYTYLPLPPRPSPCTPSSSTHTLSLSLLPLEGDGYVLSARDQVM